jgi:ribosomal protein S27AE
MGRMKEIFMQEIQEKYGDYDTYVQVVNEQSASQWVLDKDTPCPNCSNTTLLQNENLDIVCDTCGQQYIEVDKALRFK